MSYCRIFQVNGDQTKADKAEKKLDELLQRSKVFAEFVAGKRQMKMRCVCVTPSSRVTGRVFLTAPSKYFLFVPVLPTIRKKALVLEEAA
jgi:hypothetical protein